MIEIKWTSKSVSDLARLYEFMSIANQDAAAKVIQLLTSSVSKLLSYPRLGRQLTYFDNREIRSIIVGQYEIRYEIKQTVIYILRIWHTKESR